MGSDKIVDAPAERPKQLLKAGIAIVGAVLIGVLVWAASRPSDNHESDMVLVAFAADRSETGDLHLLSTFEDATDLTQDSLLAHDTMIPLAVYVVSEGGTTTYPPFQFTYQGHPLFITSTDWEVGDWRLNALDGQEVTELGIFKQWPVLHETASGMYVVASASETNDLRSVSHLGSCTIYRLDGNSTEQVVQGDECLVNPATDTALLIRSQPSSEFELVIVDLGSGTQTPATNPTPTSSIYKVAILPDNRTAVVSGFENHPPDDPIVRTVAIDMLNGETLVENDGSLLATAAAGFLATPDPLADDRTASFQPLTGGDPQEVLRVQDSPWFSIAPSESGRSLIFHAVEGDNTTISAAEVTDGVISDLVEVIQYASHQSVKMLTHQEKTVLIDSAGVIQIIEGTEVRELGTLYAEGTADPYLVPWGAYAGSTDLIVLSAGDTSGIVDLKAGETLTIIEELGFVEHATTSADRRWMAVVGAVDPDDPSYSIALVDLESGDTQIVGDSVASPGVAFSDDYLYLYSYATEKQSATSRIRLGGDGSPELVAEAVIVVPSNSPPFVLPHSAFPTVWQLAQ